jgi:hypothetical protein
MKSYLVLAASAAALLLPACNGSSASSPFFPSNTSYVRVAHGSPDAGAIDVQIDGSTVKSDMVYGTMSSYVSLKTGAHALNVYRSGDDSGKPIVSTNFSVNSGQDTTVVITGERRPSYSSASNLALQAFTEEPYSTPNGGGAIDFHHAAPIVAGGLHLTRLGFGYSLNTSPGNNALGLPQSYGGSTGPQGLPSSALNVAITLYGRKYDAFTITPGDAMTGCTGIPCSGQSNLSLYLIDGPRASRSPSSSYPKYFPPSSKVDFIGTFDGNGLIQ